MMSSLITLVKELPWYDVLFISAACVVVVIATVRPLSQGLQEWITKWPPLSFESWPSRLSRRLPPNALGALFGMIFGLAILHYAIRVSSVIGQIFAYSLGAVDILFSLTRLLERPSIDVKGRDDTTAGVARTKAKRHKSRARDENKTLKG